MKFTVHGLYGWSMVSIFFIAVYFDIFTTLTNFEVFGVALAAIFSDMIIYGTYLVLIGDKN